VVFYDDERGDVQVRFRFGLDEGNKEEWNEEVDHCKLLKRVFGEKLETYSSRRSLLESQAAQSVEVVAAASVRRRKDVVVVVVVWWFLPPLLLLLLLPLSIGQQ